jgi:bifunctional non-homologous end joining protein LigD
VQLPFVPMLLARAPHPVAGDGWLCQVKWDGVRNLTLIENGEARHWSRRLRERTHLFPELEGLGRCFPGRRLVLDGELVVLEGGIPRFHAILERDVSTRRPSPQKVEAMPASLMIFDLLEVDGEELYQHPLEERLGRLANLVPPGEAWQVVESFPGLVGPDLLAAVVARGLEGVVVKRLGSPYRPGMRSSDWLKVKRKQRVLAVVVGYTSPLGRPGGLLLGARVGGQFRYIGRVGSGLRAEELALLKAHLPPGPCPFDRAPSLRDRFSGPPGPVVWTEPILTVEVEFTEWTEDGRLRDPVLVGFSNQPPEAAEVE